MGDRQTTNFLLAIIAGVLLFGSAAVTGAIKWVAIIGGGLLLLWAVLAIAGYLLREAAKALREAREQSSETIVITIFGMVVMVFLPVFFGYALLLWLDGVPKPLKVVMNSWVGTTWLSIIVVGAVSVALTSLSTYRSEIVPSLRYGLSLLIRCPLAPLFLTMYGWRKARTAGDGVVSSAVSASVGLFCGLMFWGLLVGIFAPLFGK